MNQSLTAQHAALNSIGNEVDGVCIQELYFNFNKMLRATWRWIPVYSKQHNKAHAKQTWALTLVNRQMATSTWRRLNVKSIDMVGIAIKVDGQVIRIFNVYNDCEHSRSTQALDNYSSKNCPNVLYFLKNDIGMKDWDYLKFWFNYIKYFAS
ncbi:hypothetical protein J132_00265 [Termitomyces sp. J132]|nr:hypothetical protein J132_00265 [Termitomyces sp. J132]